VRFAYSPSFCSRAEVSAGDKNQQNHSPALGGLGCGGRAKRVPVINSKATINKGFEFYLISEKKTCACVCVLI
jgi:hypothetical protein